MTELSPEFIDAYYQFIGNSIRRERLIYQGTGIIQAELGGKALMSTPQVCRIERGTYGSLYVSDLIRIGFALEADFRLWLPSTHAVELALANYEGRFLRDYFERKGMA